MRALLPVIIAILLTGCATRPPHTPITIAVERPDMDSDKLAKIIQVSIQNSLKECLVDNIFCESNGDIVITPTVYITSASGSDSNSRGVVLKNKNGTSGGSSGHHAFYSGEYIAEILLEEKKDDEVICVAGISQTTVGGVVAGHYHVAALAAENLAHEMDEEDIARLK